MNGFVKKLWYLVLMANLFSSLPLQAADATKPTNSLPNVKSLESKFIHNFFQVSSNIYSGSAPEGEAGFQELKERGIKSIISVDGSKPDVQTAKKFGLRYVHLPFGYNGIPDEQALRLVKASEKIEGSIFVHCHHGIHRGPAAVGVICMAEAGWSPEQAHDWLNLAGTDTNYPGLFLSVKNFTPPTAETLTKVDDKFPEIAKTRPLQDVMVELDSHFDVLKKLRKKGFDQDADQSTSLELRESILIYETLKEMPRTGVIDDKPVEFKKLLGNAMLASQEFHSIVSVKTPGQKDAARSAIAEELTTRFDQLSNSCLACHKKYRN